MSYMCVCVCVCLYVCVYAHERIYTARAYATVRTSGIMAKAAI